MNSIISSNSRRLTERNSALFRMTLSNYWKAAVLFGPLNGLDTDNFILQIGAVQAEGLCIFAQFQILKSAAYIGRATVNLVTRDRASGIFCSEYSYCFMK